VQAILLDIEGTTTPINFVYGTLFPYARKRLASYLAGSQAQEDLDLLYAEYRDDTVSGKPPWESPPTKYIVWLMDQDRKSRALKSIQGKIWLTGYQIGELKAVLFDDVYPAIKRWKAKSKRVCIYSSGSVLAQKLLFQYSSAGDLLPLIDAYFDTEVGAKRDANSYKEIANRLELPTSTVLFISDSAAECAAASDAGMRIRYAIRPGNKVEEVSFTCIRTFDELDSELDKE